MITVIIKDGDKSPREMAFVDFEQMMKYIETNGPFTIAQHTVKKVEIILQKKY